MAVVSIGEEIPREVLRVIRVRDAYVALRVAAGVNVEPAIAAMEGAIERAIIAVSQGDVLDVIAAWEQLKGFDT